MITILIKMSDNDGPQDHEKEASDVNKMDEPLSPVVLIATSFFAMFFIAICIFPLAGDWTWIEGWLLVLVFGIYFLIMSLSLNKKNPRVLRNRIKYKKEKLMKKDKSKQASSSDKYVLPILGLSFFLMMVIIDLDHRFDWSLYPVWLEIIGFGIIIIGVYIMYKATLENAYASKVLDIREDQELIDTGVYAHVRHPLYTGASGMMMGFPFALGSWWGIIPGIICVASLILRIKFEEKMLLKELDGYEDYKKRVKYKLIPKLY